MILAGDIGGTNTRLALFEDDAVRALEIYPSQEFESLGDIVRAFRKRYHQDVSSACFGVAGPVHARRAKISNLTWEVDGDALGKILGLTDVIVANDLEVTAHGIGLLAPSDFVVLHDGDPDALGNQAVIAAGTGLGEAGLYWDGTSHRPFATEGGHSDYAPRNELEAELLIYLTREYRRVSYERVVSGPGLYSIYRFLKHTGRGEEPPWLGDEIKAAAPDPAPVISQHALSAKSELCVRALELLVALYGAEAGNLALKLMATGGVFVAGGIAPKILPKLREGIFMTAFLDKSRMQPLLERVPVRVVTQKNTALIGAAHLARVSGREGGR